MSVIDKVLGAITPPVSEEKRAEATQKARDAADTGDWLSMALDHHDRIRAAFAACGRAESAEARVMLAPVLRQLSARDQRIVRLRFVEERTQQEIAETIGLTQAQVSRVLTRILDQLRAGLAEPLPAA